MKIISVTQGTPEWLAVRATHDCASEAPAMMGLSKYKTRASLLREKATGLTEAVSPELQALFDRGHVSEAAIRPYVETIIGDDLFPVVGEDGKLLASLDGITMDGETIFEHKLWNQKLVEQIAVEDLEPTYYWQLEHQLHVSGAKRVIFVCSDGTPEQCVHMIYTPVLGRATTLVRGWDQFEADLANWKPEAAEAVIEKKALMALPALSVQLVGKVTTSNLPAYRESALEFIRAINTDLQTDQDFADAELTVKFCEQAETNLKNVKDMAIGQTATIDELFRAIDQISGEMRTKRLALDKLVKSRKDAIRAEIILKARGDWNTHLHALNLRLRAGVVVTVAMPDYATAIKGKRTLASLREAIDSVQTAAKIAATQQADLFISRLTIIDEVAKDHTFLVRDLAALVAMPTEMLSAVIKQRITDHVAEVARKAEADRVQQELAKKVADDRARLNRERLERESRQPSCEPDENDPPAQAMPAAAMASTASVESFASRSSHKLVGTVRDAQLASRPTDEQIINTLALYYRVHESKVIEWLLGMDLETQQRAVL